MPPRTPTSPTFQNRPLGDWQLFRVLSVIAGTPQTYTAEQWALNGDGDWEAVTGGLQIVEEQVGYTLPAADLSEVTLAEDDFAFGRPAPLAGNLFWELIPAPGGSSSSSSAAGWLAPCRCATTANVDLTTDLEIGDAQDGITLALGDRVFVPHQTAKEDNGIYVVTGGAPSRASDADTGEKLVGAQVRVVEGTVNANSSWACVTPAPLVIDVDDNEWEWQYPLPDGTDGYVVTRASSTLIGYELTAPDALIVAGGGLAWLPKITMDYTDFAVAAGSGTFGVYTLPAGCVIHACIVKTTTQFACPAGSALTFTIGVTANNARYQPTYTLSNAPSGTNFGPGSGTTAPMRTAPEDFGATTTINAYVTSGFPGFANLNTFTQGEVDICFLISTPPF